MDKLDSSRLEWHFRAEDELDRIAWVEAFLAGTLLAADDPSDVDVNMTGRASASTNVLNQG